MVNPLPPPAVTVEDLKFLGVPVPDESWLARLNANLATWRYRMQLLQSRGGTRESLHDWIGPIPKLNRAASKASKLAKDLHSVLIQNPGFAGALGVRLQDQGHDFDAFEDVLRRIPPLAKVVAKDLGQRRIRKGRGGARTWEVEAIEALGLYIAATFRPPKTLEGPKDLAPRFSTAQETNIHSGPELIVAAFVLEREGLESDPQRIGDIWRRLRSTGLNSTRHHWGLDSLEG